MKDIPTTDKVQIEKVAQFAARYETDPRHAQVVRGISLCLFDELKSLHALGDRPRLLLEVAALLHDIGWCDGGAKHHKRSRDMIIEAQGLPFDREELIMAGLIARYHRKSLPKSDHKYFADLPAERQHLVCALAAFVRIADGLDSSHEDCVDDLTCAVMSDYVQLDIRAKERPEDGGKAALEKADLFERVFKKKIRIAWLTR